MNLGKLDRLVTLLAPGPPVADAGGFQGPLPGPMVGAGQVWAQVRYPVGSEATQADQLTALQPITFTIRYRPDVRATWRVIHENQTYQLTAVAEIGRRAGLILTALRRGEEPAI